MDILNKFGADPALVEFGVWFHVDKTDPTSARFLIARHNNHPFRLYLQGQLTNRVDKPSDEEIDKIFITALSKHVLLGWENVTEDGVEVEFSEERAFDLLSRPELRDFREWVAERSQDMNAYRLQKEEEDLGN